MYIYPLSGEAGDVIYIPYVSFLGDISISSTQLSHARLIDRHLQGGYIYIYLFYLKYTAAVSWIFFIPVFKLYLLAHQ